MKIAGSGRSRPASAPRIRRDRSRAASTGASRAPAGDPPRPELVFCSWWACARCHNCWEQPARGDLRRLVFFRQGVLLPWAAAAHLPWETGGVALAILCTATAPRMRSAVSIPPQPALRRRGRAFGGFGRKRALDRPALQLAAASLFHPLAALVEKELKPWPVAAIPRGLPDGFSFARFIWWPMMTVATQCPAASATRWWSAATHDPAGRGGSGTVRFRSSPRSFTSPLRRRSRCFEGQESRRMTFVVLEIVLILLVCALLRVPLPLASIVQAVLVTLLFALLPQRGQRELNLPAAAGEPGAFPGDARRPGVPGLHAAAVPVMVAPGRPGVCGRLVLRQHALFYEILALDALAGGLLLLRHRAAVAAAETRKESSWPPLGQSAGHSWWSDAGGRTPGPRPTPPSAGSFISKSGSRGTRADQGVRPHAKETSALEIQQMPELLFFRPKVMRREDARGDFARHAFGDANSAASSAAILSGLFESSRTAFTWK